MGRRPTAVPQAHELYELAGEPPELDQPILLQAMSGFVDAGSATRLACEQLQQTGEHRTAGQESDAPDTDAQGAGGPQDVDAPDTDAPDTDAPGADAPGAGGPQTVARFDLDLLLDYRSRRPTMLFVEDHWESYDEQELALQLLHDHAGTPYLLLAGPEPDLLWDRFIEAVIELVERFDVRLTVGMNAIPMAVPHTRPVGVTAHATRPELVAGYQPWLHRVQVPASAGNLLELRLGEHGHDAAGFAAHVPHYLAQNEIGRAHV